MPVTSLDLFNYSISMDQSLWLLIFYVIVMSFQGRLVVPVFEVILLVTRYIIIERLWYHTHVIYRSRRPYFMRFTLRLYNIFVNLGLGQEKISVIHLK